MDIKDYNTLSTYGRFHFRYLGYDFQSIATGAVYTKGLFYDKFRILAISVSNYDCKTKLNAPKGFVLTKSNQTNNSSVLI